MDQAAVLLGVDGSRVRDRALYVFKIGGELRIAVTRRHAGGRGGRRLSEAQLTAILDHQIGHLELGATRFGLITAFLTTPSRVVGRLSNALAGIVTRVGRMRGPSRRLGGREAGAPFLWAPAGGILETWPPPGEDAAANWWVATTNCDD